MSANAGALPADEEAAASDAHFFALGGGSAGIGIAAAALAFTFCALVPHLGSPA